MNIQAIYKIYQRYLTSKQEVKYEYLQLYKYDRNWPENMKPIPFYYFPK